MALAIRPIPTLTGNDAARFIAKADEVVKRLKKAKRKTKSDAQPQSSTTGYSRNDVRKMWAQALDDE